MTNFKYSDQAIQYGLSLRHNPVFTENLEDQLKEIKGKLEKDRGNLDLVLQKGLIEEALDVARGSENGVDLVKKLREKGGQDET